MSDHPQGRTSAPLETAYGVFQSALGGLLGRITRQRRESERTTIAFVAPTSGAGTTTLAGCCALGLTRLLGIETTLVEANLHRPALARYLGREPRPGLLDVFEERSTLEEALRECGPQLRAVTAGGTGHETVFPSARFAQVLEELQRNESVVLLDAPPILDHPESALVLEHANAAVLILGARQTRKAAARSSVDRLEELGVPVLGTLFNRYRTDMPFGLGDPDH